MRLLAIDPGNTQSGWCVIDTDDRYPIEHGKTPNEQLLALLADAYSDWCIEAAAVEMIASYGMAVGKEVFETCVWIGRYVERLAWHGIDADLVNRRDIKLHHCNSAKAKDSNIRQALVDRFAPGQPNHGKGTKAQPGWFHGFAADVWQAYALAVYAADTLSAEGVA